MMKLRKAILYYESVSYELGLRFETAIEKALDHLETDAAHYFNLEDKRHRRIIIEVFLMLLFILLKAGK